MLVRKGNACLISLQGYFDGFLFFNFNLRYFIEIISLFRHLDRHAKVDSGEAAKPVEAKATRSNLIQCQKCDKKMPKNTIKRHLLKHKRLGQLLIFIDGWISLYTTD